MYVDFYGIVGSHYEWLCQLIHYQPNLIVRISSSDMTRMKGRDNGLSHEETTQKTLSMLPMGHGGLLGA